MWEPKMYRLAWQLLGMLGNVLGLLGMLRNVLGMLCNVLGMLATSSASSACFPQGPRSPTSKKYPPTCCLISCEAKGVVYHQVSILVVHYSLSFTAYKAASGGYFFDVGLLGPCGKHAEEAEDVASMHRTLQSMPRTLRSMPRRPRTLPNMPRSCQASLHILGSHTIYIF